MNICIKGKGTEAYLHQKTSREGWVPKLMLLIKVWVFNSMLLILFVFSLAMKTNNMAKVVCK
jgi:hypothetical protein